jgi:hypothetical protein
MRLSQDGIVRGMAQSRIQGRIAVQVPDANIRASSYYIAQTSAQCLRCGQSTRVIALALPESHEILIEDEWQPAEASAFLFYATQFPEDVQGQLLQISGSFHLSRRDQGSEPCWSNHCAHCGELLSDDQLHCEPGGGFMPSHVAEAHTISLFEVRETFWAMASGYAPDPEFFAQMRKR